MKNQIDLYNSEIISLWEDKLWGVLGTDSKSKVKKLCPMFIPYEDFKSPVIVLGINPSHSDNEFKGNKITNKSFLDWNSRYELKSKELRIKSIQKDAHKNANYFKKIKKFFKDEVHVEEEDLFFLDLFPIRHTEQIELIEFLKDNSVVKKTLIKLFRSLLQEMKPRAIVVLNKKASEYLQIEFKENLEFEKNMVSRGKINLGGDSVPIVFSGMITNGLDVYSRERLAQQICETMG